MDKKELDKLTKSIDNAFGKGSFFQGKDRPRNDIKLISSGSIYLDLALGGGYPFGRIIEIFGGESSGKTTLALQVVANVQKDGLGALFIDSEHALDMKYANKLGVNTDDLCFSQPGYGEMAMEILDRAIDSKQFGVIVVDSVAALTPKSEIEGEVGDSMMGKHARMMSQVCRKIAAKAQKNDVIVMFINQERAVIGGFIQNQTTTTGGKALQFYASQRLKLQKRKQIKDGDNVIGHDINIKVVKNKIAPPYKVADVKLLYGVGISKADEIIELALEYDIIDKKGSWFSYGEKRLGQGLVAVREIINTDEKLIEELLKKIKKF